MPRQVNDTNSIGEILHEWSIAEYDRYERGMWWYLIMVGLGVALVIYAVATGNFLFALIVVLFAIVLFLQSHQDPIILPFRITDVGVVVNNRLYLYSEFESFYIIYNPPETKMLLLETKKTLRPLLRIPLMDINPNEVRSTLLEYMVEDTEKEEEPFADMIARQWMLH